MKTILVTTDFSPVARNAVKYAADMAVLIDAGILLLYVAQLPLSYSEMPLLVGLEDEMRNMEKQMDALKEEVKLDTNGKIQVDGEVGMGVFFSELKQVCERVKPYMVVMGSQGKTATEHLLFGSHAVQAMKQLNWPVITVPPGSNFAAVKKVALACDLEDLPGTAQVAAIKQVVTDLQATLDIINTGDPGKFDADVVFESTELEQQLKPVKPVYHFIKEEHTDEAIMNFAGAINTDLLIVLPRRHNLLDRLLHKSHTKKMVLHSRIPVLAIHM